MWHEMLTYLSGWSSYDTWIVVTGALAAMGCALPGNYLVLRRQSLMGDALSHTVLLGLVGAFLLMHAARVMNWISPEAYSAWRHAAMFGGAIVVGVLTALLTAAVERLGKIDGTAALGVVFTTLFALGLLLIRLSADTVHIDPDCVLYGTIETVVMDTLGDPGAADDLGDGHGGAHADGRAALSKRPARATFLSQVPRAAAVNGAVLAVGLVLVLLFYKELRISAFDPELATALGINAQGMHYALMAATSIALVAAFESVGSILVIAMLIVPAATASLLTERLSVMIGLSLVIAAASALLGHVAAITLPPVVFGRLGFPEVRDASTAGMMGAATGLLFVLAVLFAPRQGLVSKAIDQTRLSLKILGEDILGLLFRLEEMQKLDAVPRRAADLSKLLGAGLIRTRLALARLRRKGRLAFDAAGYRLTDAGRQAANDLIRSHRLWEVYMARHFAVPETGMHAAAERVEHYIDSPLRETLDAELERPQIDPQGKNIPSQSSPGE